MWTRIRKMDIILIGIIAILLIGTIGFFLTDDTSLARLLLGCVGIIFVILVFLLTQNPTITTTYQIAEEWKGCDNIKFDRPVKITVTKTSYPWAVIRDKTKILVETQPKEIVDGKVQKEPTNKDRAPE